MTIDYDFIFGVVEPEKENVEYLKEKEVLLVGDGNILAGSGILPNSKPVEIEASVFNLTLAKSKLNIEDVGELEKSAEKLIIENDADAKKGLGMAMQCRKLCNAIEKSRKEIVRPHLDFQKAVKQYADDFTECLKKIERSMSGKIETFQAAKELEFKKIREEQERVEREAQIKLEKEQREFEEATKKRDLEIAMAAAKAEKENLPPPPPPPPPVQPKPTEFVQEALPIFNAPQKIEADDGTSTTVVNWVYEIGDESLIPRTFLMVDERAIKEAVKGGVRNIAGIKIYEKTTRKYRVKG